MLNKLETTAGKKAMLWWVYKSMILCSSVVSQCFSTTRGLKNTRNGRRDYGEAELKHFMYEFQFLDLINCCPGKLIHVYYCVIIISAKPQKSTFELMGMKKKKWPIPDKIKTNEDDCQVRSSEEDDQFRWCFAVPNLATQCILQI